MGLSATSAAAAERFETEIVVVDGSGGPEGFVVFGVLFSDKEKCVANRQMSLVAAPNAAPRGTTDLVYDTDRSSGHGAWAFYAQGKAPSDTTPVVVVNKKVLSNGTVCKGAKLPLT